jgi:subtilisin family serine protease
MKSLDFRLKHELSRGERPADEPVRVVLSFTGKLSAIEALGFTTVSRVGDVATGTIPFGRLGELGDHPGVLLVEGSSSLKDETDLSLPAINLTLPGGGGRTVPSTGRGAVIGVIDSGFDLTHPTFCDASGKTRIIAAWDQTDLLNIQYEGQLIRLEGLPPRGFGYGVEYKRETINELLARRGRLVIKNDAAAGGHGTQVAGVAAGNGAPDGRFVGVAPEAELVLVAYRNDVPIGGSSFVIDAIAFIVERAAGRRVVINLSQGDNLGAHDGSSLLERTIDWYAAKAGVLFVNSAGNERGQRHHARGRVSRDKEMVVRIEVGATNPIDGD